MKAINHNTKHLTSQQQANKAASTLIAIRQVCSPQNNSVGITRGELEILALIHNAEHNKKPLNYYSLSLVLNSRSYSTTTRITNLLTQGLIYRTQSLTRKNKLSYYYFVSADGLRMLIEFDRQVNSYSL